MNARRLAGLRATVLFLATFIALAASAEETVIATYKEAFAQAEGTNGSWLFLWNAPMAPSPNHDVASGDAGGICDPETYMPLVKDGNEWGGPGGIRLGPKGGHPGQGARESGTAHGRYAITGFRVEREGYYVIRQSYLRKQDKGWDYIDVIIHANACRPVLRKTCQSGEAIRFDTDVGYLPAGSVIYVAVGPGMNSDGDDFEMDFALARGDAPSLQEQINRAKSEGHSRLKLVPGRYYSTNTLTISEWKDFDIDATGVTLIAPPTIPAVLVGSCRGGRLSGLTIDQDPLPLTQGRVAAIGPRREWMDLKIDDFYPVPHTRKPVGDRNMIFDAATLEQKEPAAGFNISTIERLDGDTCRLNLKHALASEIQTGDLLSFQSSSGPAAFAISSSEKMVFEGITLHSSAGFSFFETKGSENTYRELKLTPGPRHLLASRPRLRTCGADGFHSSGTRIGPKVSNSLFERMGDDGMAIHGPWGVVIASASSNKVFVTVRTEEMFRLGEALRFFRFADHSQARGRVASYSETPGRIIETEKIIKATYPFFDNKRDYKYVYLLTLNGLEHPNLKPGDLVAFPEMNGDGFEFRNNTIRGGRSRGIIVKANGIIAGNHIEKCQKPGILVYSAFGNHDAMEAQFVDNLTISNNVIDGCVFMHPVQNTLRYCGGIVITADVASDGSQWGSDGHKNIRLENNIIRGVYRGVNMTISDVSNVVLRNNTFIHTHEHPGGGGGGYGVDNKAVIWIDHADGVTVENCNVKGLGKYGDAGDLVSVSKSARNVSGGLRLEAGGE